MAILSLHVILNRTTKWPSSPPMVTAKQCSIEQTARTHARIMHGKKTNHIGTDKKIARDKFYAYSSDIINYSHGSFVCLSLPGNIWQQDKRTRFVVFKYILINYWVKFIMRFIQHGKYKHVQNTPNNILKFCYVSVMDFMAFSRCSTRLFYIFDISHGTEHIHNTCRSVIIKKMKIRIFRLFVVFSMCPHGTAWNKRPFRILEKTVFFRWTKISIFLSWPYLALHCIQFKWIINQVHLNLRKCDGQKTEKSSPKKDSY